MAQFLNKKFVIVSVVIIFGGISLLFRERISSFLTFQNEMPPPVEDNKKEPGEGEKPDEEQAGPALPAYKGADPAQIRPNPEEIKSLSDEQREKLYSQIRTHANEVKANPNYFVGWLEIGLLKKTIGDFAGARDAWEYVSLIRPQNSVSFANLGEIYWHYLPDYVKAEKNFRQSIANKSDDSDVYVSLSDLYAYSYKEKEGQADDVLLEGLNANPDDINLMKALAALYERNNETAKALEWWAGVLEREPDNSGVKTTIEELKKKLGQ